MGMEYAIGFFKFLAGLTNQERTDFAIKLGVFGQDKPFYERALDQIKDTWENPDEILEDLNSGADLLKQRLIVGNKKKKTEKKMFLKVFLISVFNK
jgi:hypothetical protein